MLEHFIVNAKVDTQAYASLVESILKGRNDAKASKSGVQRALNSYVTSAGEKSRFKDIISEAELKGINPQTLVDKINNFFDYNQDVFYYGSDVAATKKVLENKHNLGKNKAIPVLVNYPEPATNGTVYYAPYDMVQAEISFKGREAMFDKDLLATSRVFNNYFGGGMASVVFQEIRESKSLAYSAYAYYLNAAKAGKYNYVSAYVGTQANKLDQAVDAMMELMNNMPEAGNQFENAKVSVLKSIGSQRYVKAQIFYYWLSLQEQGIDYDINKDIYDQVQKMSITDLVDFFNKHIKGKAYNVGLIGKKDNLDWEAVKKIGPIKELTLEDLFGY